MAPSPRPQGNKSWTLTWTFINQPVIVALLAIIAACVGSIAKNLTAFIDESKQTRADVAELKKWQPAANSSILVLDKRVTVLEDDVAEIKQR